jgi:hypothetical protein
MPTSSYEASRSIAAKPTGAIRGDDSLHPHISDYISDETIKTLVPLPFPSSVRHILQTY